MTMFEQLLQQALQLPEADRGKLAAQLLRSLDPEDEAAPADWQARWTAETAEIDRRAGSR